MAINFSLVLVLATLVTGVVWGAWLLYLRQTGQVGSTAEAREAGRVPESINTVHEPVFVEYARSFFPVLLVVLVVRSFLYEPFRIPSSSMMQTLLIGDFIFVNKYEYGLRLPVLNTEIVDFGEPKQGDVVVFRLPADPSTNYIKRLIGMPGDKITYRNKRLYIND